MTLDELREEAKKLGYKLVKVPENVKLLSCPACGKKRTEEWIDCGGPHTVCFRRCYHCGFDGYYGKSTREARRAWNEAVETYKLIFGKDRKPQNEFEE